MADNDVDRETGRSKMADFYSTVRAKKHHSAAYDHSDVLAVLTLLSRGHTISAISRNTLISRNVVERWKHALLNGTIEMMMPGIFEAAAHFDQASVPEIAELQTTAAMRQRLPFSWQQQRMRLEAGENPYSKPPNGNGNGHL